MRNARILVIFWFALTGVVCGELGAAPTAPQEVTFGEAQGHIRLDMRVDGTNQFVFPSIWEETIYKEEVQVKKLKRTDLGLVQYWTTDDKDDPITGVKIEIYDKKHNKVVWDSENLIRDGKQALPLVTGKKWTDSGFWTRTNTGFDAFEHDNQVAALYKFLDPAAGPFRAVLTIIKGAQKDRQKSTPGISFEARYRTVGIANQSPVQDCANWGYGCHCKTFLWKGYGLKVGGQPENTDPTQDGKNLLLDYRSHDFAYAYTCATPGGARLMSFDHGDGAWGIRLGTQWAYGFSWGAGGNNIVDVSGCAHAHRSMVVLFHCLSDCCACSLANALTGKVGGEGSRIVGYASYVGVHMGIAGYTRGTFTYMYDPSRPPLTDEQLGYFTDRFDAYVTKYLVDNKIVIEKDGAMGLHPEWIAKNTVTTVVSAVKLDENAFKNSAYKDFAAKFGFQCPPMNLSGRKGHEHLAFYFELDTVDLYGKNAQDGQSTGPLVPQIYQVP
jgi:hypothetical protein